MAKKADAKRGSRPKTGRSSAVPTEDKIIDALMGLLATRSYCGIGLADIAEEAGVSLTVLRGAYVGKPSILADFSARIDQTVLDAGPAEGETARDRLFEILMRRFDALEPYRDAIRTITQAMRADVALACFAHRNAARSMKWMLAGAGAENSGMMGTIAREGLILVHAETLRVWLDDDEPGLAKTMAALDRALGRGVRAFNLVGGVCTALRPFRCRDRATRDRAAANG